MSSFIAKVRHKETGEERECFFYDDYFGRHQYGMKIEGETKVLTETQFAKEWERV